MKTNIAIVFPGQGSQSVGMLADLAPNHSIIQETFTEASDVLGYDLWQLSQQDSQQQLNQTEYTQPALLTAGVAVWRLIKQSYDIKPSFMAGHSLGEYTALTCAGALSFTDAVKLVQIRGRLMQQAAPGDSGAMAAIIGLTEEQVCALCNEHSTTAHHVAPANFNGTGQIVIAGHRTAVESCMAAAKAAGARLATLLPVSVPAHSIFMKDIVAEFKATVNEVTIVTPNIAVIQNVDAEAHQTPEEIKSLLLEQLYSPVQWTKTLMYLANNGVNFMIEAGPGKVLAGLAKRTIPHVSCVSVNTEETFNALKTSIEA